MSTTPFRVGLTGGIGSGKTEVANRFAALGVTIIDADHIAHELTAPKTPPTLEIRNHFGNQYVDQNGELNRQLLRELVFANPQKREELEAILHPLIRQQISQAVSRVTGPYCIISIPLLAEGGGNHNLDRVLVVNAESELRIERVIERSHIDRETVLSIISVQATDEQRTQISDDTIDNNGSLESLYNQVKRLHKYYVTLAEERDNNP